MSDETSKNLKSVERILAQTYITSRSGATSSASNPSSTSASQLVKVKFYYEQGCKILSFNLPLQWDHFYERIRNFNPSPHFVIQRRSSDGALGKRILNQHDLNAYLQCAENGKLRVHVSNVPQGGAASSSSSSMHNYSVTTVSSVSSPGSAPLSIHSTTGLPSNAAAANMSRSPSTPHSIESGVDSISGRSCTDFNVIRRNMMELRRRRCSGNSSLQEDMRWTDAINTKSGSYSKCSSPFMMAQTQYEDMSADTAIGGKASTYPKRTAPMPKGKDGINSLPRYHNPEESSHPRLHNQAIYTVGTGATSSSTTAGASTGTTGQLSGLSNTPQLGLSRWDQQSMSSLSRASSTSSCLSTDSSCPWQRGTLLGRGSFGVVYQCMDRQTGMEFAVKEILLSTTSGHSASASQNVTPLHQRQQQLSCTSDLEAEMEVLRSLEHLRIVHYYGVLRTQRALYVCMEYLPEGSLYRKLHTFGPLSEPVVRNYTKQILQGLAFLHQKMIVHRDLKAANILCDRGELKLADFGTAVHLNRLHRMVDSRSFCGTPYWMSPELLRPSAAEPPLFCQDTWSLGATVIEMLTGNPPYYQMEVFHAAFEIRDKGIPREMWPLDICPSAETFLAETFQMNPQMRPVAADLLTHAFVQWEDHLLM